MVNRRLVVGGIVVGGGAVVAYSVYKYEKNKQAANAAAADAASAATAASGYGYGYGYGTSQGAYGYGGVTYGYGASGGFPAGYYGYGVPIPPTGGTGGGGTGQPPVAATTNAQWDQAAVQQMSGDGWNPMTVASALGAYLNGQEVNSSQVNIIDAAIGIEGYPPVAGASGFPPGIKTGGTTGGGQNPKVTVPNIKGKRAEEARDMLEHVGLKDHQSPAPVKGKEQIVTRQNPTAGKQVNKGSTVSVTVRTK